MNLPGVSFFSIAPKYLTLDSTYAAGFAAGPIFLLFYFLGSWLSNIDVNSCSSSFDGAISSAVNLFSEERRPIV